MSKDTPQPALSLREIQSQMAQVVMNPLTEHQSTAPTLLSGESTALIADRLMKPNSKLSSLERIELYNRQYWFRLLDCLYDDFPGLRAILGEEAFYNLRIAYLKRYPSQSYSLRNLPDRLILFLEEEPQWLGANAEAGIDMARFEWAQIIAFDGPAEPPLNLESLHGVSADQLKLKLQPYISLLDLQYPFDEFILALKKQEVERSEAGSSHGPKNESPPVFDLPAKESVFLAVHRHENALFYKRLSEPAFRMLRALDSGATVSEACAVAIKFFDGSDLLEREISNSIQQWFLEWGALGWFVQIPTEVTGEDPHEEEVR